MWKEPKKSERRPADRVYPKPQSQTPSGFFGLNGVVHVIDSVMLP